MHDFKPSQIVLTPDQIRALLPVAFMNWKEGLFEMSKRERQDDFGTADEREIWDSCEFLLDVDGELTCHQPNDVVLIWNPKSQNWDDYEI